MTEPNAGSAVTDLKTRAVKDGDGFRVTGSKVFTSNSPDADIFLVYVRYHEGLDGIGSVLMDTSMEGFSKGKNLEKLGMKAQDTSELFFQDVQQR